MNCYFIRHGIALDRSIAEKEKIQDSKRYLTNSGKKECEVAAKFLARKEKDKIIFLYSPYVRSRETAYIFRKKFPKAKFQSCDFLQPNYSFKKILSLLNQEKQKKNSIALIGHEPFLSSLATILLGGDQTKPLITLKKSGIACLRFKPRKQVKLALLIGPKWMRLNQ